jgi:hypothetical protein
MFKVTPNPPENSGTPSEESLETEKLKEAAERAFAHYFPPTIEKPPKHRKGALFTVSPDIDTEALLANAVYDEKVYLQALLRHGSPLTSEPDTAKPC